MKSQYFYVTNIKSYLTVQQEVELYKNFLDLELVNKKIIFCGSYLSISLINSLNKKSIFLGAQNCSMFDPGAYTGEISAKALNELNVEYCIVGHSERRQYFNETNEIILKKIEQLFKNNMVPILCVGETKEEFDNKKTKEVLYNQLSILKNQNEVLIAYEPVWAIGTGVLPSIEYINEIYSFINNVLDKKGKILYGGSVNSDFAKNLKKATSFDGFLIGKASTDFQELKKIVLS